MRETGDGVARIEGLSDVMLNEMIEFPSGVFGLALNLEETEVGAILMGDDTWLKKATKPKRRADSFGAGGQGAVRPRGQHARAAARRQRPDQNRDVLSG